MWRLGTCFIGGIGSGRFVVGLDDFKGPFQPKCFYDSILWFYDSISSRYTHKVAECEEKKQEFVYNYQIAT